MSTGVAAMGRILAAVAAGPTSVAALAEREGLARSSSFDIVARLEAAGLVNRDGGMLAPGPLALRLAFAAHGIAPLAGPAEALLALLRDETDGTARLRSGKGEVLSLVARWDAGETPPWLEAPVRDERGQGRAMLGLALRPSATRTARAVAEAAFERIRISLEFYLESIPIES